VPSAIRRLALVSLVLLAGLLLAEGDGTGKGKKYALLVGVKAYDHHKLAPLRFTENDVTELAKLLRPAGYDVTLLSDSAKVKPTGANVKKALTTLLAKKSRDDTVLVALAGHGLQLAVKEKDVSFFCPSDAQLNDPDSLVSLEKLFQDLDDCAAGVKLLLVDACRNDPGAWGARNLDVDTVPRPPRGIAALFSCASGQRAFETKELGGGHGVFFHYVLEGLRGQAKDDDGEVSWGRLSEYVSRQVNRQVPKLIGGGARQTPHLVTNLVGESPVLLSVVAGGGAESPKDEKVVGLEKEFTNAVGMKMVRIPKGKFLMGSTSREREDVLALVKKKEMPDWLKVEGPQHEVEVSEFFLGAHEVTVGQFRAFVKGSGYRTEAEKGDGAYRWTGGKFEKDAKTNWKSPGFSQGEDHPVTCVSWDDARAFCDWLSKQPDKKKPGEWAYRLPREAEWEYACRGGASSYRTFHFGNSLSSAQANFDGNYPYGGAAKGDYLRRTTKVGSYEKNVFGLYDMHGNVWEWCSDWFDEDYYKSSPSRDPAGPSKGSDRVIRGGSWSNAGGNCRSAYRVTRAPGDRYNYVGFRVALVPSSRASVPE
jgi:formylglycine-generating enzyme required for sulfatase activity